MLLAFAGTHSHPLQYFAHRKSLKILKYYLAPVYNILAALSGSNDDVPKFFRLKSSIEDVIAEAQEMGAHYLARHVGEFYFFLGWSWISDLTATLSE